MTKVALGEVVAITFYIKSCSVFKYLKNTLSKHNFVTSDVEDVGLDLTLDLVLDLALDDSRTRGRGGFCPPGGRQLYY